MFVEPEVQCLTKDRFISSKGMLVHKLSIELEPEFLNGIGPRRIGGQTQQANFAVDALEIIKDIRMKVDRPVIQRNVDHARFGIMLLHVVKEAVHLLDGKRFSPSNDDLPRCHIQGTSQANENRSGS